MSTRLHPAWKNVEHAIIAQGRWTYGDVIAADDLQQLLDLPKPSASDTAAVYKSWQLRMLQETSALREQMLQEHSMCLWAEPGVGLRILMPNEQTQTSEAELRRQLSKALRDHKQRILHVDKSQLSAEERKQNTDAQVRLATRVQALRGIDRERLINLPTELPRA